MFVTVFIRTVEEIKEGSDKHFNRSLKTLYQWMIGCLLSFRVRGLDFSQAHPPVSMVLAVGNRRRER